MRAAIRQLLLDGVPEVEGRVLDPQAASGTTTKPFLVLKEGTQRAEAEWSDLSTAVEVWPYAETTAFDGVDSLAASILATLDGKRFSDGDAQYLSRYCGCESGDLQDSTLEALTMGLRFGVFALGWLNGQTDQPDPVAALRSWTAAKWPELQTDPTTWAPTDAAPGVYWRMKSSKVAEKLQWGCWLEGYFRGHVVAPSAESRELWTRRVADRLATETRVGIADGSPLVVQGVLVKSGADPMRSGQVRLTARFGVRKSETAGGPAGDLLQHAIFGGSVNGEVS